MKSEKLKIKSKTRIVIKTFLTLFTIHFSLFTALGQIAVKGETVHTMNGEPIANGVVLITTKRPSKQDP